MLSLSGWPDLTAGLRLLARGGPVMVPLLGCSLLALAVVFERLWTWRRLAPAREADGVLALAARGEWDAARAAGEASRSPVARVLAAGLRHPAQAPALAMEAAALAEAERLKRHLPILDTIVTLSPLLGLLGTVTGMIGAFGIMAQDGMNEPHAITGGVAEALIATATGLAVAILALVPYNAFQARVERLLETMERYGSQLELLLAEARGAAGRAAEGARPPAAHAAAAPARASRATLTDAPATAAASREA